MTPNDPSGRPEPGADPELPAEDEAGVRAILAALPDPELPADVRDRITAALAAEPAPGRVRAIHAAGAHRAPARRLPRLLQVAAAVAVLGVGGIVAINVVGQDGSGSGPTGGTVVAADAPPGPVTSSGANYTAATVPAQVTALLTGSDPAAVEPVPQSGAAPDSAGSLSADEDAGSEANSLASTDGGGSTKSGTKKKSRGSGAGSAPNQASAGDGPDSATASPGGGSTASGGGTTESASGPSIGELVQDPDWRTRCIGTLAGAAGVKALSIDAGTYEGRPAAVVVLPDADNPARADVWVVGPTCSEADSPFPYSYFSVALP